MGIFRWVENSKKAVTYKPSKIKNSDYCKYKKNHWRGRPKLRDVNHTDIWEMPLCDNRHRRRFLENDGTRTPVSMLEMKPGFRLALGPHSVLCPPHPHTPGCKVAAAGLFTSEGPGLCSRNVTRYGLQEARPIWGER